MNLNTFNTSRLTAILQNNETCQDDLSHLLSLIPCLLTPKVVVNLPPYFHEICSQADALQWYEKMVAESLLYVVRLVASYEIIGFIFVHQGDNEEAHIGYLLGESFWGKGYANEMLLGFIHYAQQQKLWKKLIAGVDVDNQVSVKLLNKLGFEEQLDVGISAQQTRFYQYLLT